MFNETSKCFNRMFLLFKSFSIIFRPKERKDQNFIFSEKVKKLFFSKTTVNPLRKIFKFSQKIKIILQVLQKDQNSV
jgi:hypothetical protein